VTIVDALLGEHAANLAADFGSRGADAVYVALASHLQHALITLDKEMKSRAPVTLVVSEPG
jgi:predicted nucleic acid-binding protein